MAARPFFTVLLFSLVVFFAVPVLPARAADFYVDEDGDNDDDGSADHPFRTIAHAIEEAMDNDSGDRSIEVRSGTYDENVTLGKSVKLSGAGKGKTVIEGKVTMNDKSSLEDLTVDATTGIGVLVAEDAGVTIENVEVRGAKSAGIQMDEGNGSLTLSKSTLKKNGKGVYVEKGNDIRFSGNTVTENGEEGFDLREKVKGNITGNTISANGEGGIELVVGGADLRISGNTITKNRSSGIATQFYSGASQIGTVTIENNKLTGNGDYGIDCNMPSGGKPSPGYFQKSLAVSGNTITDNKDGEIDAYCKLIDAVDAAEEASNKLEAEKKAAAEKEEEERRLAEEARLAREAAERELLSEIETVAREEEAALAKVISVRDVWLRMPEGKRAVFGLPESQLIILDEETRNTETRLATLRGLFARAGDSQHLAFIQSLIAMHEGMFVERQILLEEFQTKPLIPRLLRWWHTAAGKITALAG